MVKPSPKTQLPVIFSKSPQLAHLLLRLCPALCLSTLEEIFSLAVELGGLNERDFAREDGVSYNPRPARVVYILAHECRVVDWQVFAAGMLSAICERPPEELCLESVPPEVAELVRDSRREVSQLKPNECSRAAAQIALSVRLDRARHLHLSQDDKQSAANCQHPAPELGSPQRIFYVQTRQYLPVAQWAAPELVPLFENWLKTFAKILGPNNLA